MVFPNDVFPADDVCEICGVKLSDEAVIQEFPDGSLARLCPDCAAETGAEPAGTANAGAFPEDLPEEPASAGANDPLEMTRELLNPINDLVGLQKEVQAALERLAASLERFATEMISGSSGRSPNLETRLHELEDELDKTKTRLHDAESLLLGATTGPIPISAAWDEESPASLSDTLAPSGPASVPTAEQAAADSGDFATPPPISSPAPIAPPAPATPPTPEETFTLEEIQLAQRYFNESEFTERIRAVRRGLGKPQANLSRLIGNPRVLVTVAWDIVWYQYLVDLGKDTPAEDRVALFREGMDVSELSEYCRLKNSSVDDEGRLDASELEVRLLSDPTVLITEMSDEEEKALEDATEEIWNQHTRPEFKWDD
jgi:hypothetical protein